MPRTLMILVICLLVSITTNVMAQEQPQTLAQALGYAKDAKVLIINADDYGMCHAENMATQKALAEGSVTSATIMMPCSWMLEAVRHVKENKLGNVGIHITLTSEFGSYRWRPITGSVFRRSTLVDEQGFFWPETVQVEKNADIIDIQREVRAQLQLAEQLGWEPSHFDSHMGSLYGHHTMRVEMLAVALANSYEFGLPLRLPYIKEFQPLREMGFAILDHLVLGYAEPDGYEKRMEYFKKVIKNLSPGVTELYIHPAINNEELSSITGSATNRQADFDIFTSEEMRKLLAQEKVHLIDYRPLKKWQRQQMNWHKGRKAQDIYPQIYQLLSQRSEQIRQSWQKMKEPQER